MATNALNTATAGLRVTQAAIGVVSQNIANVGTAGYVKRTLSTVSDGVGNSGVATGLINRTLDEAAQTQLRLETSGSAYTGRIADVRGQLDKLYGQPGSATALDGVVNGFAQALQGLAADPTSPPARSTVVDRASSLAAKIGGIAQGVQNLRGAAESQLATEVRDVNDLLSAIANLNTKIVASGDDSAKADLLDQRDQKVTTLASFLDVKTVPQRDGSATIVTGSGLTLVERAVATTLSFDQRPAMTPEASYSTDPAKRGVGTIIARQPGGAGIDLIADGGIGSGSLAAGIELRDTILPQAQRQLDDLAAGLSRSFSDRQATGTAVTAGTASGFDIDLTGLSAGNAITLSVRDAAGTQRNLILVPSNLRPAPAVSASDTSDPSATVIGFSLPTRPGDPSVADTLAGLLSPTYSVTAQPGAGALRILSDPAANAPTLLATSASVTVPRSGGDTQTGQPQFALFVDGARSGKLFTGSIDGGSQLTGFAQRIAINPSVAQSTATLVNTSPTTQNGDTTRPDFLYDALTRTNRTFSAASGIGGINAPFVDSVQGFAQRIVDAQGAGAANAKDLDEGQTIALSTAQSRFASKSGVKIDDEMSTLIQLQTAYTANARVLTAARDMLDTLMRI
ncbi:flagellar hook-associated protein FlgK [Methylobacterium sp. Leaf108]|uniref:flagellar hook-associated protein FlgK n=1 Tax=Methylobacterium sp. Leaf108 TaxID=1736256 RepID=UPI0006FECF9F|nr:flagellar hook-associated protein FlgK [Methylobacterium sp. Leaf108]KQP50527.1 flagellar biosynthesis protein FlgK [Methylobacterium sp. Leaf108]